MIGVVEFSKNSLNDGRFVLLIGAKIYTQMWASWLDARIKYSRVCLKFFVLGECTWLTELWYVDIATLSLNYYLSI